MPTPTAAVNAYTALARLTDPGRTLAKSDGGGDAGASFGSLLKTALGAVVDAGRKSDAQSQSLAAGKANVVDVVTAVAETEVAIESLVAVRDRVVQAYDEIMKMPI